MKLFVLAAPLGLLLASGAFAQTTTDTTTDGTAGTSTMQSGSMMYGTDWSDAVGSAFYSDADHKTMRTPDEIVQSWPSLPQADRDMVKAECKRFKEDTNATDLTDGSSDATGTGAASTDGTAATDTSTATDTDTGTTTGTDASGSMSAGYDTNTMMVICPSIENL